VTLFWRPALIEEATGWLRRPGYTIAVFDASTWASDGDMHRDWVEAWTIGVKINSLS